MNETLLNRNKEKSQTDRFAPIKAAGRLTLEWLEPRLLLSGLGDDYGDYAWNAAYIPNNNDSYSGYIGDYGFDKDMFSFYATAGATYGFATTGFDTLSSIKLSLVDQNGYSVIDYDSSYLAGISASLGWAAPSSGDYYLEIKSPFYNTGDYSFTIVETLPTDDHGDTPAEATYVYKNTWNYGTIEESWDTDCFGFYAYAGYDYTLETSTGTLTDTYLWLQDIYGNNIDGDDNSGTGYSSQITWTAPSEDYYYAAVQPAYYGFDYDYTGSYALIITERTPIVELNSLEMDSVVYKEFSSFSDIDYYSFQALAGHEYHIRSTHVWENEFTSPFLYLFDQDFSTILESDIGSGLGLTPYILWTAPESGTYYIEVTPYESLEYFLSIGDGPADWTFMVYIAGDNDLEEAIGPDVEEMIDGILESEDILTPNINLILQTDGWEEYSYNGSYWQDSTWRYVLSPAFFGSETGEKNMGDEETLINYINWASSEFPADNYSLVLWDHGGGFKGVCYEYDEYGYDWDYLAIGEMQSALSKTSVELDILGFDACLMSMVEVAYQFKDYADIFIASETLEPGSGWKYDEITYAMADNPNISAENLAQTIVNAYQHEYEGDYLYSDEITTLAAFDLTEIDLLADALDDFATTFLTEASLSDWFSLRNARYGPIQMMDNGYPPASNFCELELLMQRVIDYGVKPTLETAARNVSDTLADIQIAEWHDTNMNGIEGISIYLPLVGEEIDPDYNQDIAFLRDTNWDEFIEVFISGAYPQFVNIPAKGLTYTDADGSVVSVKLAKGTGTATFSGDVTNVIQGKKGIEVRGVNLTLDSIDLTGSTDQTSLTLKAKGGSIEGADLGGITGSSLGKLNAKQIDLLGGIDLTGNLVSVVLDDIGENAYFDVAGTITKFQAVSFTDGLLRAETIGQVKIKSGDFGPDVEAYAGDIMGISVKGDITGDITADGKINKIVTKSGNVTGVIRAGNGIGSVQAVDLNGAVVSTATDIKKVSFKGDIIDSYILAGYDVGSDCAFGLQGIAGTDHYGNGNIVSVMAKGTFARSYLAAGALPSNPLTESYSLDVELPYFGTFGIIGKVKFGSINTTDATYEFGLFAVSEIKSFKVGRNIAEPDGFFRIEYIGA